MKIGSIAENIYNRTVKKELSFVNDKCADFRRNCAFFDADIQGKNIIITNTRSSSLSMMNCTLSVISSLNELIIQGAEPVGLNINLLMSEKYSEEKMRKILASIEEVLDKADAKVLSFHGENASYIKEPVLTCSAIGYKKKNTRAVAKPGNDIVMIGTAGYAGASILAIKERENLLKRLPADYIDGAVVKPDGLIVKDEAALAIKSDDACIYHVSEGGVYATLWNMASESRVGLDIYIKNIPIKQETVEICNYLDLNPYELMSEGSLLVSLTDGQKLVDSLLEKGIKSAIIGKVTDSNDKVIINEDERKFITKPCPDELFKYI